MDWRRIASLTVTLLVLTAAFLGLRAWGLTWWSVILSHPPRDLAALGQLGDSVAPITALFAILAALGAWLSYRTQRAQLQHERASTADNERRASLAYFDELFFRLLDEYGKTVRGFDRTYQLSKGRTSTHGIFSEVASLFRELNFKDVDGTESPLPLVTRFQHSISHDAWHETASLVESIQALTRWLHSASQGIDRIILRNHGSTLVARLSDVELWLWQLAIAATLDNQLVQFSAELGVYADDHKATGRIRGLTHSTVLAEIDLARPHIKVNSRSASSSPLV